MIRCRFQFHHSNKIGHSSYPSAWDMVTHRDIRQASSNIDFCQVHSVKGGTKFYEMLLEPCSFQESCIWYRQHTVNTKYFTIYTANCSLHSQYYKLNILHWTIHTERCRIVLKEVSIINQCHSIEDITVMSETGFYYRDRDRDIWKSSLDIETSIETFRIAVLISRLV